MNEEEQAALEASEAIESDDNTQAGSQSTEQTPGEATEPTGEEVETAGKGAAQRIKELNQRAKSAETRAKSLEDKIAELTGPSTQGYQPQVPDYNPQEPIVKDGEEIDVNELNRRIADRETRLMAQAEARVELKSRQSEAINRIKSETAEVLKTYPQLDPDSLEFDQELSETVTEAVEAQVRANPYSASVTKFVGKLMKPYAKAVAKEVGEATANIAKQATEAALRPTSIRKTEKSASEKSIAELEAELGIVYS
jgi:septum formation topological specificity factor MinE